MSIKTTKILYWSSTGLLSVIVMMYVGNSIFNHELFSKRFLSLGYPVYIIYPLSIAKLMGLVAIWSNKIKTLKEWAYAGFGFVFILAILAEAKAHDGEYFSSPLALILLSVSYLCEKRILENNSAIAHH